MTVFIPDTNVWIDARNDAALASKFEEALAAGDKFLIGPPALLELMRGTVRQGSKQFSEDQKTYRWMKGHGCGILELTKPFMAKILGTTLQQTSNVVPKHYEQLIEMAATSATFEEFVKRCNASDSVWKNIESLDQIHEGQLDYEMGWLKKLAGKNLDIAATYSMLFGAPGCRPSPLIIKEKFSAFIEYLESAFRKVVQGADPERNDRGMYVDFQLLTYLAIPEATFLTSEKFTEISKSPQKDRIVKPDTLP